MTSLDSPVVTLRSGVDSPVLGDTWELSIDEIDGIALVDDEEACGMGVQTALVAGIEKGPEL